MESGRFAPPARKRTSGFLRILGVYQVVMGVYLAAVVVLFIGRPICTNIDAPCSDPGAYRTLLPAPVGMFDLVLISINIAAGTMLMARKRWVLLPVLVLQVVDLLAILPEPNRYALIFTLGLILPAGWFGTFVAATVQTGADSGTPWPGQLGRL